MFDYKDGIMTENDDEKIPRLRCGNCKAIDSMNKPYGKMCKCYCEDKNCKGAKKLKCEFCDYKYSEEY